MATAAAEAEIKSRIRDTYMRVPEGRKLLCGETTKYFGISNATQYTNYGRVPQKPEFKIDPEHPKNAKEQFTAQDLVENIRIKIGLKDRHLKILKEETEEVKRGSHVEMAILFQETLFLRKRLVDTLNLERFGVLHALRTQREFQLAMNDKSSSAGETIAWVQDRTFQVSNRLNLTLYELIEKSREFQEAENEVIKTYEEEKHPTITPWERHQQMINEKIEVEIDNIKVKRETASILQTRYKCIKMLLENEKLKYRPKLEVQKKQLRILRSEKKGLQVMLKEAQKFTQKTLVSLEQVEKETTSNRRYRRKELHNWRRSVQDILDETQGIILEPQNVEADSENRRDSDHEYNQARMFLEQQEEIVKEKKRIIELFQHKAERLVKLMKVPNLTYIPARIEYIENLNKRLLIDICNKERLRNYLVTNRDNLSLLLCHFKYSGLQEYELFKNQKTELEKAINDTENKIKEYKIRLTEYGHIIASVRFGIIAILQIFDETKKKHKSDPEREHKLDKIFKTVLEKLEKLVEEIAKLKLLFGDKKPKRDYYQKLNQIDSVRDRHIRTKASVDDIGEHSDGKADDMEGDYKVPSREEVKRASQKLIHRALQKRQHHDRRPNEKTIISVYHNTNRAKNSRKNTIK